MSMRVEHDQIGTTAKAAATAGRGRPRILVTGFGPFPGAPANPTAQIARRVAASRRLARLGCLVTGEILPVIFADAERRHAALIAAVKPDIVLHLGLAARRRTLSVETRALNRISRLHPDAERRFAACATVAPGGAQALPARWPGARLCVAMNRAGAATRLSVDAGSYVCNQTLYLTLARTGVPAGFIHVPRPRGPGHGRHPRPTLTSMVRAVEAALVLLVAASHGQA
jgi:pyroglutamyl-peptidase